MSDIVRSFNDLDDPRTGNATRHLFPEIMFIAFLCVLCGGETAVDMAGFAEAKEDILREFLELPFGTPSHDTFSRVFQALDPDAIAIDGKTLRGSFDHATEKSALNMVTAWGHGARA